MNLNAIPYKLPVPADLIDFETASYADVCRVAKAVVFIDKDDSVEIDYMSTKAADYIKKFSDQRVRGRTLQPSISCNV